MELVKLNNKPQVQIEKVAEKKSFNSAKFLDFDKDESRGLIIKKNGRLFKI